MRKSNYAPTGLTRFICLLLVYVFVFSSGSLAVHTVNAAANNGQNAKRGNPKHPRKPIPHQVRELLVRFRADASDDAIDALVHSRGAVRGNKLKGRSRFERIHLTPGQDPEAMAAMLAGDPNVELIEPNSKISKDDTVPNDPSFPSQWGLQNSGTNGGSTGSDINVVPAWDKATGTWHTTIAVIDSGIDFTHPDLKNREWLNPQEVENGQDDDGDGLIDDLHGWDYVTGLNEIKDGQGHGTAIAGIIAAEGNNETGITGVMWQASLMSLRVLDDSGSGDIADAVEAIDYAVAHGAKIINCSWGTDEPSQALHDAIVRAGRQGVLVVASAGNGGHNIDDDPYYPASFNLPNVISVAGIDNQDNLAVWSNWSPTQVTIAAPGVNIQTTKMGGGYQNVMGTSAAAPFVSGVAGLLNSYAPLLQANSLRKAIIESARQVAGLSGKVSSGGVVNAAGAMDGANIIAATIGTGIPGFLGGAGNGGGTAGGQGGSGSATGGNGGATGQTGTTNEPPPPGDPDPSMPNLDIARRQNPTVPKIRGKIHSNLCWPDDPDYPNCLGGGGNEPPTADAGGPYTGTVGNSIFFYGLGSSDPDGYITSYGWNFGDGGTSSSGTPSHTYAATGSYTVTLTVYDNNGDSNTAYTSATISTANQSPAAHHGGPYSGYVSQNISFNGSTSSDPDGTIASYSWNFGDGYTGTGATPFHAYSAASTYTVSLTVTDNQGATNTATTTATISTITNQPPVSVPGGLYGGTVNSSVSFNGSNSHDPDGTISSYSWNFGDGGTGTGATPSHTYTTAGSYTVSLTVTDNNGASSTATTEATITTSGSNPIYTQLMDPINRVGSGGEDPFSRNFNFGVPILGLPGRAGMSLGLGLSYNSLVWTKEGGSIGFNLDQGFPGPGFHLGFPTIQTGYNTLLSQTTYLMISPGGGRTEFRQIGTTNVYETADSTYTQLTINSSTQLTVRSLDGSTAVFTQTSTSPLTYKCTQVKDRNGNYITIAYDTLGNLSSVVDTLGRTINFVYNTSHYLTDITQSWAGTTHTWATFTYGSLTLSTSYSGLTLVGASNNQSINVLTWVSFPDGSSYKFDYNSYAQVNKISHIAADSTSHVLAYTSYDFDTTSNDCPRINKRHDFAENWNLRVGGSPTGAYDFSGGTAAEAITTYTFIPTFQTWTTLGGGTGTGARMYIVNPDGLIHRIYFVNPSSAYWSKGLPQYEDTYAMINGSPVRERYSYTTWTQDNTSAGYIVNPRIIETNAFDSVNNHHRATVDYTSIPVLIGAAVKLPSDSYEYQADATTVYRKTHTSYMSSESYPTYIDLRIIGLPVARYVYAGGSTDPVSHVEYLYDDGGSFLDSSTQTGVTQHDDTNFGSGFIAGRGNLTKTRVYDGPGSGYLESQIKYFSTGTVKSTVDPGGHTGSISYTDSFSTNPTNPTYAYPTRVTDAAGFYSTIKYNYDFGAAIETYDPKGAESITTYDSIGRVSCTKYRDSINTSVNNGEGLATRFVYPSTQNYVESYTLTQTTMSASDFCSSSVTATGFIAATTYSAQVFDGAGRVRSSSSLFPGSTGGYRGQKTFYDVMGRAVKGSHPTEMTGAWAEAGDDTSSGWIFTSQTYDWAGRPLESTNEDNKKKSLTYTDIFGFGTVVTAEDEMLRKVRVTPDFYGRILKTEVVVSTDPDVFYKITTNTYTVLDQVTNIEEKDGSTQTTQNTTKTYDGFGRVLTAKSPIASSASSYTYNSEGLLSTATDARGVVYTYTYDSRHKTTGVSFSTPSGVTATSSISYGYDSVGNRTSMSDGTGSHSYSYDTWSRMTSETQTFTGLSGSFTLSYSYNLAGQLASITNPFSKTVNYSYDKSGQLTAVDGSGFTTGGGNDPTPVSVPHFASNFKFRAWGALEHMEYANDHAVSSTYVSFDVEYNNRMQLAHAYGDTTRTGRADYTYYDDGQIETIFSKIKDGSGAYINVDPQYQVWDRKFTYDQFGRAHEALTGNEAHGGSTNDGPYHETYGYDCFGNLTSRHAGFWSGGDNYGTTYVNNRDQNQGTYLFQYDAAGNVIHDLEGSHTYDAAGDQVGNVSPTNEYTISQTYDGDGQPIKHAQTTQFTTYSVRSSVLGAVITELKVTGSGQQDKTRIYALGQWIATQEGSIVSWRHNDLFSGSWGSNYIDGIGYTGEAIGPMGQFLGYSDPFLNQDPEAPPPDYSDIKGPGDLFVEDGDPFNPSSGCTVDGMPRSCGSLDSLSPNFDVGGPLGVAGRPGDGKIPIRISSIEKWLKDNPNHEGTPTGVAGVPGKSASIAESDPDINGSGWGHGPFVDPSHLDGQGNLVGDQDGEINADLGRWNEKTQKWDSLDGSLERDDTPIQKLWGVGDQMALERIQSQNYIRWWRATDGGKFDPTQEIMLLAAPSPRSILARLLMLEEFLEAGKALPRTAKLTKALIAKGAVQLGRVAHHIVAVQAAAAATSRVILYMYNIGIDEAENGVFLEEAFHQGTHTNAYYAAVQNLLFSAGSREEVIQALDFIRQGLQNGTFPPK